ncbi:F-box/kelch-repeat protein At1g23390-like [Impatiens glandulifera]|uniref:F-box/kelch-repeat protein At1g23390-like n=1 Tax=Impatiens glandulifera TaxID=253017 RepID=UPI001FB06A56|nr:F-box/kelch-repeat protein At1g23390-like [Impatiens glandulifera]
MSSSDIIEMKEEEEEEGASASASASSAPALYGDVLESILSNVPLVHLASASLVSTEWKEAVWWSLRHLNPAKPWLFMHGQGTRTPYSTSTRAYDSRSPQAWMQIQRPSIKHVSTLRSAHSGLLYMLSPSRLSFSSDPFHLTWHHADSPFVWRTDPIVALLGTKLIVAGGGCDFEDDPLAVEIYDLTTQTWGSCEFMPAVLKDSSASTCLSVATDGRLMFVVQRQFGIMHTFDPESNIWTGPFDLFLRPPPPPPPTDHHQTVPVLLFCSLIYSSSSSSSNGRLILIGLIDGGGGEGEKDAGGGKALKLWSVDPESLEKEEIGEMPKEMLEEMLSRKKEGLLEMSSIGASCAGNWVYIYYNTSSSSSTTEIYVCEMLVKKEGGGCRWRREEIPSSLSSLSSSSSEKDERRTSSSSMERVVFTCSQVTFDDINNALRSTPNWKCSPIPLAYS